MLQAPAEHVHEPLCRCRAGCSLARCMNEAVRGLHAIAWLSARAQRLLGQFVNGFCKVACEVR